MKASTLIYLAGLVLAVAGLAVSIAGISAVRARRGVREYLFACWGAASETQELQALVIDPINARNRDFHVTLVPIPSDYETKLTTMIAGRTPPEFFYLSQEYVPAFAAQGALLDLTDLVARDDHEATDLSSYYPVILERFRYGGRLYGLPWIAQPVVLYCNAGLFRDAGVALPDRSWDWRRFVRAAKALTKDTNGDGRVDQWGFILNGWPPYLIWVWQNGADVLDPATGELDLGQPRVAEAIDFYAGLIHENGVAPPLSIVSEAGFSEMFKAGKVAMFMGGAADDLDRIEGLEVVVAELPTGPTGLRATFAWTAGLGVSASVGDPEPAFEVYKQILDGIHRWKIPAPRRPLTARLEQFEPRKARAADVIRASMEYMRTPVIFERHARWATLFDEEFQDELLRLGTPARHLARRTRAILRARRGGP